MIVCFYFQVHQPMRIRKYRLFDIGLDHTYFIEEHAHNLNNQKILEKVANKCYLPTNALLLRMIQKEPRFKISFSFSGIFLEQLEMYAPAVLKSFQDLVNTGNVEILSETYYHSLAYLFSKDEFKKQVKMHDDMIQRLFGKKPNVFRNTELIFHNDIGYDVEQMGYTGILAEGADHILGWRSPNFVYRPLGSKKIKLLLKNYKLSDDIAFRFSSREWKEYPLTAPKFAQWVSALNGNAETVNLFMDYETFGEHQWEDTGIFNFMEHLPAEILSHPDNSFATPSEVVDALTSKDDVDFNRYVSWADVERDLSAWISNPIQHDAIHKIYEMEDEVMATGDAQLINDWRRLQTSDHFYYMCTKWFADGDVHKYFNPYESPYEAFIHYTNVLQDMRLRLNEYKKPSVSAYDQLSVQPIIHA